MKALIQFWQRQKWLDQPAKQASETIAATVRRSALNRRLADVLHGTWLGHPLHPVLTDVPIGAWSVAGVFDAIAAVQGKRSGAAAAAVSLGVVASLPAAASGLIDWHYLQGPTKRIGAGHAAMNGMALACYLTSLGCRLLGSSGRLPAYCGLGFMTAAAYLGGHLVFSARAGVEQGPAAEPPVTPVPVDAGITYGELQRIEHEGYPVVVCRTASGVHALSDTCPHMGCSLAGGRVEEETVVCSCHGSAFSLKDGSVVRGPSVYPVAVFKTVSSPEVALAIE
jgi:nitrite reductase/ring-hydroxylating ferredoxin subunit/uncharacterized membrane protein